LEQTILLLFRAHQQPTRGRKTIPSEAAIFGRRIAKITVVTTTTTVVEEEETRAINRFPLGITIGQRIFPAIEIAAGEEEIIAS